MSEHLLSEIRALRAEVNQMRAWIEEACKPPPAREDQTDLAAMKRVLGVAP